MLFAGFIYSLAVPQRMGGIYSQVDKNIYIIILLSNYSKYEMYDYVYVCLYL